MRLLSRWAYVASAALSLDANAATLKAVRLLTKSASITTLAHILSVEVEISMDRSLPSFIKWGQQPIFIGILLIVALGGSPATPGRELVMKTRIASVSFYSTRRHFRVSKTSASAVVSDTCTFDGCRPLPNPGRGRQISPLKSASVSESGDSNRTAHHQHWVDLRKIGH
jgi:hypothetical protein